MQENCLLSYSLKIFLQINWKVEIKWNVLFLYSSNFSSSDDGKCQRNDCTNRLRGKKQRSTRKVLTWMKTEDLWIKTPPKTLITTSVSFLMCRRRLARLDLTEEICKIVFKNKFFGGIIFPNMIKSMVYSGNS